MKNSSYILISLFTLSSVICCAQNKPKTTTMPTGSGPGAYGMPARNPMDKSSLNFNYLRTYNPLTQMTTIPHFNGTKNLSVEIITTYKDGWDRPLMQIHRNNSGKDVIQLIDSRMSPTSVEYLPYADTFHATYQDDGNARQASYYYSKYPSENFTAYTKSIGVSNSGLRLTKSYAPGRNFVGENVGSTSSNDFNYDNEVYKLTFVGNICKNGYYPAGQLSRTKSQNQHGQLVNSYKDKMGRLICTRVAIGGSVGNGGYLTTYYMYNEMGKLICVVPPKACEQLVSSTCLSNMYQLCHVYDYDDNGNLVAKFTPGKNGADYAIYDKRSNVVASQTPALRANNQWAFVVFDNLGRDVFNGIYQSSTNNPTNTSSYWQGIAAGTITPVSYPVSADKTVEYYLQGGFNGSNYPDSLINCQVYNYKYYDDYAPFPANKTTFNTSFSSDYLTGYDAPTQFAAIYGDVVASRTRVLTNGVATNITAKWKTSIYFYDEQNRLIQTQSTSMWDSTKWDIVTSQFNFKGNPVLQISRFNTFSTCNKGVTKIQNKYNYGSKTGRQDATFQKIDNGIWMPITTLQYDDLGRVKTKLLGEVEQQDYSYNMRGQLTGINAANLYSTGAVSKKTYFSEINYDTGYDSLRLDGLITGYKWRTPSSPVMSYGYNYDRAARMVNADYYDFTAPSTWSKTSRDFSVSGISFDANGNMLTMKQRGYDSTLVPSPLPKTIDSLFYTYDAGNQLQRVEDFGVNSRMTQDFKNFNKNTTDYSYDADGNLTSDLNKKINSIKYNQLDLPLIVGKSNGDTIKNIYDGSGTLLQKTIKEGGVTSTYRYLGPFVFRNDSLLYTSHTEGRARWLADSGKFRYDYFVKDHLGNIRNVITSDVSESTTPPMVYSAGWELLARTTEEAIFSNIGQVSDGNPAGTPNNVLSARLHGADSTRRVAASILLHGMAGDQFSADAVGLYQDTDPEDMNTYATGSAMTAAITSALSGGITNPSGENGTIVNSTINSLFSPLNYGLYNHFKDLATDPDYPRAYLNILVYDEGFTLRPLESQIIQLRGSANTWNSLTATQFTLAHNGYIVSYVSNESNMNMWADAVNVRQFTGRLLEENLYYPHGMVVSLGSVQGPTNLKNRYLHQGKELQEELGMQLYDFHARQYDPQIGRFWGIDPADQFPSGYTGMGNDPANMIDPSGMQSNYVGFNFKGIAITENPFDFQSQHSLGPEPPMMSSFDGEAQEQGFEQRMYKSEMKLLSFQLQRGVHDYLKTVGLTDVSTMLVTSADVAAMTGMRVQDVDRVLNEAASGRIELFGGVTKVSQRTRQEGSTPEELKDWREREVSGKYDDSYDTYQGDAAAANASDRADAWKAAVAGSSRSGVECMGCSDPGDPGDGNRSTRDKAEIAVTATSTTFDVQGQLVDIAAKADNTINDLKVIKAMKGAGLGLTAASAAFTVEDMYHNGLNEGNSLDAFVTGVSFIPNGGFVIGFTYTLMKGSTSVYFDWANRKYPAKPIRDYGVRRPQSDNPNKM